MYEYPHWQWTLGSPLPFPYTHTHTHTHTRTHTHAHTHTHTHTHTHAHTNTSCPPTHTHTNTHRPYFSFDPAVVKKVSLSRSNDSLDKAMEDPVRPSEEEPTSTEVVIHSRSRNRERRYSAPPERRIRDSVGSMDYLSESQGE